ncbi:Vascular endothelial growth factor receptor [Trichinella spiralis]|uniref:Vascular endothelial growth factor receptor n=1 Tax=Trichinella spiralis TaxID=6334 RepID=A0ABR3KDS5_TRISP
MELWHVPFSKHWAVLDTNARHVETLLLLISERRSCRTLHFWQRPCGPVPIMWFTPSKQVSGNSVNPPSTHCPNVHHIDKQRPRPFFASSCWMIRSTKSIKKVTLPHTSALRSYNVQHLYFYSLAFHSSLHIVQRPVRQEVADDSDDGITMPYNYIHISITSKVISTSLLFHWLFVRQHHCVSTIAAA